MAMTLGRALKALRLCEAQQSLARTSRVRSRCMSVVGPSSGTSTSTFEPSINEVSNQSGNNGRTLEKNRNTSDTQQEHQHVVETSKPRYLMKLQYLHPSTKTPRSAPRPGDLKTGRIRSVHEYIPLSKHVFGISPIRRDVVHAAVLYYLHGRRKGLAHTRTRGEISFSGAKIRPQKGSGQARLGRRNNPLLRKGGVIHGPKPRDMSTKLNRRVRELALRSALSAKLIQGQLKVVKSLDWVPPPSTGLLRKTLGSKRWDNCVVLTAPRHPQTSEPSTNKVNPKPSATDPVYTTEQEEEHKAYIKNFIVASNNAPTVEVINLANLSKNAVDRFGRPLDPTLPGELHAYYIIKRSQVILDLGAVEWLEEKLGGAVFHDVDLVEFKRDLEEARDETGAPIADVKDYRNIGEAERVTATI